MRDERKLIVPIRILIVDDHGIVREGLTALLDRPTQMKVVGVAGDGRQAVLATEQLKPDVVVMDLLLPELSGIDATARIVAMLPQTRVVMLSACDTSEHVFQSLRAGARGYVLKANLATEIVRAVLTVSSGDHYLSPQLTGVLVDGVLGRLEGDSPLESLSAREREVLHLTVGGARSADIGRQLCLSRKTVDTYRSRVMVKLGVPNLAGLIHFGITHGIAHAAGVSNTHGIAHTVGVADRDDGARGRIAPMTTKSVKET
jgi:DNA-binding NarL/FixJ family response regulator